MRPLCKANSSSASAFSERRTARSGLWRLLGQLLCPPCCRHHSNDVSHEAAVCGPPMALLISPRPIASKAAAFTCQAPLSGFFLKRHSSLANESPDM